MGPRRGRFLLPPACLINLTCGQQGHCWVVIPIIRRITVLHLTAGGRVAVGHVLLGAPHEESLHAGVESGEGGAQEDRSAEIKDLLEIYSGAKKSLVYSAKSRSMRRPTLRKMCITNVHEA